MQPGALSRLDDAWPDLPEKRNENILVWVGANLVPRCFASMSVFDSTVQVSLREAYEVRSERKVDLNFYLYLVCHH